MGMGGLRVHTTTWPDRPHWRFDVELLGTDGYGTWVLADAATLATRGDEPPRLLGVGFVALVPSDGSWWVAEFYRDHPHHEVYVNIGTPPSIADGRISQVDLDLDVVRLTDGSVAVLDRDEFDERRRALRYPSDLVDAAEAATGSAVEALGRRREPFGSAAEPWLAKGLG